VAAKKLSQAKFDQLVPELIHHLGQGLQQEKDDCALSELSSDPFWETPEVDSKTVAKMSPIVKDLTGFRINPRWIRKGGYDSIDEAVVHIISKIREHHVDTSFAPAGVAPNELEMTH
jgi:hypothetical protein